MNIEEQNKELTKQAVEIACEAAGKYMAKEGLVEELDNSQVWKEIKDTIAENWNRTLEDCREAEQMGGQYIEVVFEANMTEAGIEAVKNLTVLA